MKGIKKDKGAGASQTEAKPTSDDLEEGGKAPGRMKESYMKMLQVAEYI